MTAFSKLLFDIAAGILFVIAVIGMAFSVCAVSEALPIIGIAFAVWILPIIAERLIYSIINLRAKMLGFIKS